MISKNEKQSAAEFAERVRVNPWDRLVANSILSESRCDRTVSYRIQHGRERI